MDLSCFSREPSSESGSRVPSWLLLVIFPAGLVVSPAKESPVSRVLGKLVL